MEKAFQVNVKAEQDYQIMAETKEQACDMAIHIFVEDFNAIPKAKAKMVKE